MGRADRSGRGGLLRQMAGRQKIAGLTIAANQTVRHPMTSLKARLAGAAR